MTVAAALPENEADRLERLRRLVVLDSMPEPVFDELARLAARICGTPIALLSLVDAERQWFKANVGLEGVHETPRELAFCAHALSSDALLEIADACADARFAANPLVTGEPHIRFYAGAPLVLPGGLRMGTLCVIDRQPRALSEAQKAQLVSLAALAVHALTMRGDLIANVLFVRSEVEERLAASDAFVRLITDNLPQRIAYVDSELRFRFVNDAHCRRFGLPRERILGQRRCDLTGEAASAAVASHVDAVLQGQPQRFEFDEVQAGGGVRRIESQLLPDVAADGAVRGFISTGVDVTERNAVERTLRELSAIIDHTTDYVVQADPHGALTYMNPAARRVQGIALDASLAGLDFSAFYTDESRRRFETEIVPAAAAHGVWLGETVAYAAGRREVQVSHMVLAHRGAQGQVDRWSSVMRDITLDRLRRAQQQRQAQTLHAVAEAIPAVVAMIGADEVYRFVNRSFEAYTGLGRDDVVGRSMLDVIGSAEYARSLPFMRRALAGETVSFEKTAVQRDGREARDLALTFVPLWGEGGAVDGFVTVAHDVTVHKEEQRRLRELSLRDGLTGLLNRAGFERHLEQCLADGAGARLALLYIDLDHFKQVNDQHGHAVGDRALQIFGQRLRSLVRPSDAVARLGGDEFAVALAGVCDEQAACRVADHVIDAGRNPVAVDALHLLVGASVGVALGATPEGGWRELLARADGLLYRAKAAGRGRTAGSAGSAGSGGGVEAGDGAFATSVPDPTASHRSA